MKKVFLIILFTVSCLSAVDAQPEYTIEGQIGREFDGRAVLLLLYDVERERGIGQVESAIVKDGAFQFKGEVGQKDLVGDKMFDDLCVVALDKYPGYSEMETEVFIEEGTIRVQLDTLSSVSGTPNNDLLQTYNELQRRPFSGEYVRFIIDNMDNFVAVKAFCRGYQQFSDDDVNEILAVASDAFKENERVDISIRAREALKSISGAGKIMAQIKGSKCADFDLITSEGEAKKLYDYIGGANYLVIDFWASWCGPCIRSMPHMVELSKKYKDKGLRFLGISLDTEDAKEAWIKAVKKINVPWEQVSDLKGTESDMAKAFGVPDVPYTVVLDKEGTILECVRLPMKYLEPVLSNLP